MLICHSVQNHGPHHDTISIHFFVHFSCLKIIIEGWLFKIISQSDELGRLASFDKLLTWSPNLWIVSSLFVVICIVGFEHWVEVHFLEQKWSSIFLKSLESSGHRFFYIDKSFLQFNFEDWSIEELMFYIRILIYAKKNLPVEYIALHLRKATCSIKMSIIVL